MKNIVIIDYGMGNLRSVQKAFELNGAKPVITSSISVVEKAEKIVLPGVGAFTHAMHELKKKKLVEPLRQKIESGTPYLGLCLGLQLLFSWSEEGERVKGFNIIPGPVRRFSFARILNANKLKIPHMGWNTMAIKKKNCPLLKGISENEYFYFVHSFYGEPEDRSHILGKTRYGFDFCSAVWKENVFATQFHPEKSQAEGLRVIKNFVEL